MFVSIQYPASLVKPVFKPSTPGIVLKVYWYLQAKTFVLFFREHNYHKAM